MKRINKYIFVFLIPIVCMVIHMAMKNCYPFGNYTILLGDANGQYVSYFKELYDKISSGGSILFSWNSGMGYDFFANFCYYLGSPISLIALLFGKEYMELGMIVSMLVQLGFCGVTALYYFLHTKKNCLPEGKYRTIICMLFATAYSMCTYILAYQYNLIWLISLLLMPLLLLGVERLTDTGDARLYFVILVLSLVTNYYFAWFVCLLSVLWFIDQKKGTVKRALRIFLKYVCVSIVAAMCAAVVLIPCYLLVLQREDPHFADVNLWSLGNLGNFFQGMFWAGSMDPKGAMLFTNNNYFGIFALVFVAFFFFRSDISVMQRIKRAAEIIVLSFCLNWGIAIYVLHGFTLPHLFSNRFAILLILVLIITGFEGVQILNTLRYRYIAGAFLILSAIMGICFFAGNEILELYCYLGSILFICYLFICLILYKRKSIKKESVYINIVILGFVELISNFFLVNTDNFDRYREREIYAEQWYKDYEQLSESEGERSTAWMSDQNCFTYSDTNIFSSAINSDMIWLFKDMGLTYQNNGGSYIFRGSTPLTNILFNVRNVLTDRFMYFGGYQLTEKKSLTTVDGTETYGIYSTDDLVGFGFMVSESVCEWNHCDNPFEMQNYFTDEIENVGDIFSKVQISLQNHSMSNCILTDYTENSLTYFCTNFDSSSFAGTGTGFTVPYDMHLYLYIHDENVIKVKIQMDGQDIMTGEYMSPGILLDLGNLKEGQNIYLNVYNGSEILETGTTYFDFYEYHDDVMQEALAKMRESIYNIDTFEDTYVSGTVDAAKDGILYTSIPYYKGFTAYVDGKKTEIVKIGDAMTGVRVPAGKHTVEFRYFTYGLKTGIGLSILGFLLVIINAVYAGKRRKNLET